MANSGSLKPLVVSEVSVTSLVSELLEVWDKSVLNPHKVTRAIHTNFRPLMFTSRKYPIDE